VEQELETVGVPRSDKPFHPHLTLGRVKHPKEAIPIATRLEHMVVDWGKQTIDSVTLMKSDLTPTGPLYTPLRRIALSPKG
jgi:2'-5' RNA ligase